MTVRAKFTLNSTTRHSGGAVTLKFTPVFDDGIPENERFSKHTPSGLLEMTVTPTSVVDAFKLGESYYLDFTPVPAKG